MLATFWPGYRNVINGPQGEGIAIVSLLVLFFFAGKYVFGAGFFVAIEGIGQLAAWMTGGRALVP